MQTQPLYNIMQTQPVASTWARRAINEFETEASVVMCVCCPNLPIHANLKIACGIVVLLVLGVWDENTVICASPGLPDYYLDLGIPC